MLQILSRLLQCLIMVAISSSIANAGFVVTMSEMGSDVVATGSGTFNTTALTFIGLNVGGSFQGLVAPVEGEIGIGSTIGGNANGYYNGISAPTTFGTGDFASASSGSGDLVVFVQSITSSPVGGPLFVLPTGYSGGSLSAQSVWANQTFGTLGITPGTYTWTWGTGVTADSYTLNAISAVPEPASLAFVALALIGALGIRKYRVLTCSGNGCH